MTIVSLRVRKTPVGKKRPLSKLLNDVFCGLVLEPEVVATCTRGILIPILIHDF
jgi:hypothetical protein